MEPLLGIVVAFGLLFGLPVAVGVLVRNRLRALRLDVENLNRRITQLERQDKPPPTSQPAESPPAPVLSMPAFERPPELVAPIVPPVKKVTAPAPPPKPPAPPIDWEAFMGVKLFAWLGGFALFLGVAFFVKYSFENNLVTPQMRVAIGFLAGIGLLIGGWLTATKRYRVPAQSLCATGVLVLYANIFAAHAFYHFVGLTTAFALMSAVTATAFLLAMSLEAQVIVVLGLLGGFCTPVVLATGRDNPAALFGYIAVLNAGVAAVALRKRWDYLVLLAAIGTVLTQAGWVARFFETRQTDVALLIFIGLELQFLIFFFTGRKAQPEQTWTGRAVGVTGFSALVFCLYALWFPELARRPDWLFGFLFLADLGLVALGFWRESLRGISVAAGNLVYVVLACWTARYLDHALLWWALAAYVIFALLHAGTAVLWQRPSATPQRFSWSAVFPLFSLALLLLWIGNHEASFAIWGCVLVVDFIAIGAALFAASLLAIIGALLLTLAGAGLWITTATAPADDLAGFLCVIAGFAVFFFAAVVFAVRKLSIESRAPAFLNELPALAVGLPFVLLIMLVLKLPLPNPTPVFGVALLLSVLLLGLAQWKRASWAGAMALACAWAVECVWHHEQFSSAHAAVALAWYGGFLALFAAFPFFSREKEKPLPWATCALSAVAHFWLIYQAIIASYPSRFMGLLPAAFIALPLAGVLFLLRKLRVDPASGDARLAWQGGAALLFVSLVFPIQFDREWITLGWALEGVLLLAFFHRVPNAGLRMVGVGLLCTAFARLALNPSVLEYHRRTGSPIWNWYLYAYGLTTICLLAGGRLLAPPRHLVLGRNTPPLLYTLGTVLAFLLLNIEIADYYSIGPTLTFSFTGNFARDMTYSIAWALFAFGLLLIGMRAKAGPVRYAGLALLVVTLVKLFLHDLGNLSQLYRIGAFLGVAVVLIVASFVYQRFLAPADEKA